MQGEYTTVFSKSPIIQGPEITTSAVGETVILSVENTGLEDLSIKALNFLRAGCEGVQFFLSRKFSESECLHIARNLELLTKQLQLPGEEISFIKNEDFGSRTSVSILTVIRTKKTLPDQ